MIGDLKEAYQLRNVPFHLMRRLSKVAKNAAPKFLEKFALEEG